jgi:hypothetical protein
VHGLAIALDPKVVGAEFCLNLASRQESVLEAGQAALVEAVDKLSDVLSVIHASREGEQQ